MTDVEKKQTKYYVTTFYKFFDWPEDKSIDEHGADLELWCKKEGLKGLIILFFYVKDHRQLSLLQDCPVKPKSFIKKKRKTIKKWILDLLFIY